MRVARLTLVHASVSKLDICYGQHPGDGRESVARVIGWWQSRVIESRAVHIPLVSDARHARRIAAEHCRVASIDERILNRYREFRRCC